MNQYQEHIAHSAPCSSRWDGFDRGDSYQEIDQGSRLIGRMKSGGGYTVSITEFWHDDWKFFEVAIDGRRVHSTEDRGNAIVVARWWMNGCPA